jgi:hypothetical protein
LSPAGFTLGTACTATVSQDYAHLVGLGLGMWLFLIFFVLLSTVLGAHPPQRSFRPLNNYAQKRPGKAGCRLSKHVTSCVLWCKRLVKAGGAPASALLSGGWQPGEEEV